MKGIKIHYLVGWLVVPQMELPTWFPSWYDRAKKAADRGNTLLVLEVPISQEQDFIYAIEEFLQGKFGTSPKSVGNGK